MIVVLMVLVTLVYVLVKRKGQRKVLRSPIAGIDTGHRSPWRTPGRRPHRGF